MLSIVRGRERLPVSGVLGLPLWAALLHFWVLGSSAPLISAALAAPRGPLRLADGLASLQGVFLGLHAFHSTRTLKRRALSLLALADRRHSRHRCRANERGNWITTIATLSVVPMLALLTDADLLADLVALGIDARLVWDGDADCDPMLMVATDGENLERLKYWLGQNIPATTEGGPMPAYIRNIPDPMPLGSVLVHGAPTMWRDRDGRKKVAFPRMWLRPCDDPRLIKCRCRHFPEVAVHYVTKRDPVLHVSVRTGPRPRPRTTLPPLRSLLSC